jgi:hypothetical protein
MNLIAFEIKRKSNKRTSRKKVSNRKRIIVYCFRWALKKEIFKKYWDNQREKKVCFN